MWESLGIFTPSPIAWTNGPSLGTADQPIALLIIPRWEAEEGKYLGRLSFRREFDTAPGDLPDAVDNAFSFYPSVEGQGRVCRLDSIPAAVPTLLKMRLFAPRWLSRFGAETMAASMQIIEVEIKRWVSTP
jgi:hypothetical protein